MVRLVSWKDSTNNGDAVLFRVLGGKLNYSEWIKSQNSWKNTSSNMPVNSGDWTHVAVTRKDNATKLGSAEKHLSI